RHFNWGLLLAIAATAGIGFAMLYSAGNGHADPWMSRQALRFAGGFCALIVVALVDFRFWLRHAYPLYALAFLLLIYVEVAGHIGMGAQRWINVGFLQLQPSELMKISLVLALARYFHGLTYEDIGKPINILLPIVMVLVPAGLVLMQPDLGTAGMLILGGALMFFAAGVGNWKIAPVVVARLSGAPPPREIRGGAARRIVGDPHRLEFPARLSEGSHPDFPQPGDRSAGCRLSHPAIQ